MSRRLRYNADALDDLVAIAKFIRESGGGADIARSFTGLLRGQCERLASLPGSLGRPRPELRADLRSFAFKSYVIFFRYLDDVVEIVNVLERHRDVIGHFEKDPD